MYHNIQYVRSFLALCWILILLLSGIFFMALTNIAANDSVDIPPEQEISQVLVKTETGNTLAEEGKDLFKRNCATCHNKNMKTPLTGPALGGFTKRWRDYPKEDVYQWIRNSKLLIDQKHPKAMELWERWKPTEMSQFPNLTDQEIESLIAYIEQ